MTCDAWWFTQQGQLTSDNRDRHGIAHRGGKALYVVVDGSSSSPNGGRLARALVSGVVDQFLRSDGAVVNQAYLEDLVSQVHQVLRLEFLFDSASFFVAVCTPGGDLHTIHAGDCRLGLIDVSGNIEWATQVHTLATALGPVSEGDLVTSENRHVLTRRFTGRRLCLAEYSLFQLKSLDKIVIATDGFWAEASSLHQQEILQNRKLSDNDYQDDISCLSLSFG